MKELIEKYFIEQDILKEAMLLEYNYFEKETSFTCVFRPSFFTGVDLSRNPFMKIKFIGVADFVHTFPKFGNRKHLRNKTEFVASDDEGSSEIYYSELIQRESDYFILVEMSYSLGLIKFYFERISMEIIYTSIEVISENEWKYTNVDTGEQIDFYHPFGNG